MNGDFYTAPAGGWTCYHCGETFRVHAQAALHFGTPDAKPGCTLRIKRGEEYTMLYTLRMIELERDELKVRLMCSRLKLGGELEEELIRVFRASRGVLAEMYEQYRKDKQGEKTK